MSTPPPVYAPEVGKFLPLAARPPLAGGQAEVYGVVGRRSWLVKMFKPGRLPPHARSEFRIVQALVAGIPNVCQIVDIGQAGRVGPVNSIVIEKIKGVTLDDKNFRPGAVAERLRVASTISRAYRLLAERECFPSDNHYGNQVVNRRGGFLIDVDSFSHGPAEYADGTVRDRHFQQGAPGFGPAEFQTANPRVVDARIAGYGLAEVIHCILKDFHPFVVSLRDSPVAIRDCIALGLMGRWIPGSFGVIDDGIPWAKLPRDLQQLFTRTFEFGFSDPAHRPVPADIDDIVSDWNRQVVRPRAFAVFGGAAALAFASVGAMANSPAPARSRAAAVTVASPADRDEAVRKVINEWSALHE